MERLVFDAQTWRKTGDIGDNSQFWKPAKVVMMYEDGTCDVKFEDGRLSMGHYFDMTEDIKKDPTRASVNLAVEEWADVVKLLLRAAENETDDAHRLSMRIFADTIAAEYYHDIEMQKLESNV